MDAAAITILAALLGCFLYLIRDNAALRRQMAQGNAALRREVNEGLTEVDRRAEARHETLRKENHDDHKELGASVGGHGERISFLKGRAGVARPTDPDAGTAKSPPADSDV